MLCKTNTEMKKMILKWFPAVDFYWRMVGWKLIGMMILSILLGFSESISLGLLIPIFQGFMAQGTAGAAALESNQLLQFIGRFSPVPISLNGMLVLFVAFMLLKAIFKYFVLNFTWVLVSNLSFKIRKTLTTKMMALDYKAYLSLETGKIASAMTTEVDRCMAGFLYFTQYFTTFLTGFSFVVILLSVNYKFSLTIIVLGGIYYSVFKRLNKKIKQVSEEITEEGATFNSLLIQVFQSFKYIKAAAFYIPFGMRLVSSVQKIVSSKIRVMRRQGLLGVIQELALMALLLVAFFVNIKFFKSDFGSILLSIILFYRASGYILSSQIIWGNYVSMAGGTTSVVTNDIWLGENVEKPFGSQQPHFSNAIQLDEVSFSYKDGTKIIDNVSLSIPKNSMVAFVGRSGSGKSTLVNLLTGLLRPSSGQVLIDGVSLNELDIHAWRKKIGYVTQEPVLFTDTVLNNITMWSNPSIEVTQRYQEALKKAHIDEFVKAIGGDEVSIGDKGALLSGGQKQRISIGREFFKNPELLIFDEATSSLDAESEAFIQRSIDEQHGATTTIIIAHRLSTLRNADIIFLLDKGKIVEQGSFDKLVSDTESQFYQFVKLQTV
ncbi:MAG: ABC transporter ATP-binding protein [Bacteroidetes bacterium]|nr:MAG: ABC transporter ATP-binding protein [Bacteroidota bacterium]